MDLFAEITDFEYEFRVEKNGAFGTLYENGTWDGMVGELVRRVSV